MKTIAPERVNRIADLAGLLDFLRTDLAWPIEGDQIEELTFDWSGEELNLRDSDALPDRIQQLRPLTADQPWGVFLIDFGARRLPISSLRRMLRALVRRRRAGAHAAERPSWELEDLLFVCRHQPANENAFTFVHFRQPPTTGQAARLTSFGWSASTPLRTLVEFNLPPLRWPEQPADIEAWRAQWRSAFDVERVTQRFYAEIANWYFWALKHVRFPKDAPKEQDGRDHISVIRTITRIMFCWFVKQKGLIPDAIFDSSALSDLLRGFSPNDPSDRSSVYYRAILQNLFFATLNTEMGQRDWARDNQHFMAHCLYRHKECFRRPDDGLALFREIPFLNGGLFECLDRDLGNSRYLRVDGFSRRSDSQPVVPDFLFFGAERIEDLSVEYGEPRFRRTEVRGLIRILRSYNFTIEENTPLDQEVALDPELAGKVFENLLAAYNPETGATARKSTGSYYTPRAIVDYMVDESLLTYLKRQLGARDGDRTEGRLRALLAYDDEKPDFSEAETEALIEAIDRLKALDPAVGSGAFPMGILHKLVHVLGKLDPGNERWKAKQIAKLDDAVMREEAERIFRENYDDYGRKLYLIENCIYGVDIQPIAVQIAKMRFFISLVADQKVNPNAPNLGVRALPNLETKFVAANTLIGIEKPEAQGKLFVNPKVEALKSDLALVRHRMFTAKTTRTKNDLREKDAALRLALASEIEKTFRKANEDEIRQTQEALGKTKKELEELQSKPVEWHVARMTNLFGEEEETRVDPTKEKKRQLRDAVKSLEVQLRRTTQFAEEMDATAKQLAAWDPYDQNASSPFFDPEWMFGLRDGFDIVIGNPPYLESRSPAFSDEMKENLLSAVEQRWRGIDVSAYIVRGADLLVYFMETSVALMKPNGIVVLITQNAWLDTDYGKRFQEFLLRITHVSLVVDSDFRHFDGAGGPNINTVITFFRGRNPENEKTITFARFRDHFEVGALPVCGNTITEPPVNAKLRQYRYDSDTLRTTKWGILLSLDDAALDLMSILEKQGSLIERICGTTLTIGQGLNLTKACLLDRSLVESVPFVQKALIPILTAADGAPFEIASTNRYLADTRKLSKDELRELRKYKCEAFDPTATTKFPPVLILPRGIGRHFCALNSAKAYSASGVDIYAPSSGVSMTVLLNLWTVLNSSVTWLLREISGRKNLGGGMLKAEATDLAALPLYVDIGEPHAIHSILNALRKREAKESIEELDTEEHRAIDDLVFRALGLGKLKREQIINSLKRRLLERAKKSRT